MNRKPLTNKWIQVVPTPFPVTGSEVHFFSPQQKVLVKSPSQNLLKPLTEVKSNLSSKMQRVISEKLNLILAQ